MRKVYVGLLGLALLGGLVLWFADLRGARRDRDTGPRGAAGIRAPRPVRSTVRSELAALANARGEFLLHVLSHELSVAYAKNARDRPADAGQRTHWLRFFFRRSGAGHAGAASRFRGKLPSGSRPLVFRHRARRRALRRRRQRLPRRHGAEVGCRRSPGYLRHFPRGAVRRGGDARARLRAFLPDRDESDLDRIVAMARQVANEADGDAAR